MDALGVEIQRQAAFLRSPRPGSDRRGQRAGIAFLCGCRQSSVYDELASVESGEMSDRHERGSGGNAGGRTAALMSRCWRDRGGGDDHSSGDSDQ
jgi:hypothetical protein